MSKTRFPPPTPGLTYAEGRHLIAVRLPAEMYERMHADAERNHRSDGAQAAFIIQEYYARKEETP